MTGAFLATPRVLRAAEPIRLGLTPVFLDNDAEVIVQLQAALGRGTGRSIDLIQRRTYQEVTGLLLEGSIDAAWLCGFPYLQHEDTLELLGVPVWRGAPVYQSFLIANAEDGATVLGDLRGGSHAFADPDSNSGWLVTASDLAQMGERSDTFFGRTIFTYGHRNVVRSVAGGLTRSGSVDGYVWEALAKVEPELTGRTKVIAKSEPLGFPPFVARRQTASSEVSSLLQSTLFSLVANSEGRAALDLLQLDGVIPAKVSLYDGIRARMRLVRGV